MSDRIGRAVDRALAELEVPDRRVRPADFTPWDHLREALETHTRSLVLDELAEQWHLCMFALALQMPTRYEAGTDYWFAELAERLRGLTGAIAQHYQSVGPTNGDGPSAPDQTRSGL
jgi:hypothetical protein